MAKTRRKVGPHSRTLCRGVIGRSIDGRSPEGRFLRAMEAQLVEHVGGEPSATERILIGRLARVALRLELFDEKLASGGAVTEYDTRVYGALHNSLRLMLRELGLKGTAARTPSLRESLDEERAHGPARR